MEFKKAIGNGKNLIIGEMGSPLRNSILSRNNRQFFPAETGFFGTDLEETFFVFISKNSI